MQIPPNPQNPQQWLPLPPVAGQGAAIPGLPSPASPEAAEVMLRSLLLTWSLRSGEVAREIPPIPALLSAALREMQSGDHLLAETSQQDAWLHLRKEEAGFWLSWRSQGDAEVLAGDVLLNLREAGDVLVRAQRSGLSRLLHAPARAHQGEYPAWHPESERLSLSTSWRQMLRWSSPWMAGGFWAALAILFAFYLAR